MQFVAGLPSLTFIWSHLRFGGDHIFFRPSSTLETKIVKTENVQEINMYKQETSIFISNRYVTMYSRK